MEECEIANIIIRYKLRREENAKGYCGFFIDFGSRAKHTIYC
jgi:hypothetical protein